MFRQKYNIKVDIRLLGYEMVGRTLTVLEENQIMRFCEQTDHEQQHGYHHDTKVKPETATAVIEFLMMGGTTPESCK
jgi:hypothetical protein